MAKVGGFGQAGMEKVQARSSLAGGFWPGSGAVWELLFSGLLHGRKELIQGPGSLLNSFQTPRKAVAGRLPLSNQMDSFTTLQPLLFPAKNDNANL